MRSVALFMHLLLESGESMCEQLSASWVRQMVFVKNVILFQFESRCNGDFNSGWAVKDGRRIERKHKVVEASDGR